MFVGLLWIPISIWQMIRSSIILFTGLIRQFWLKKPLKKSEWWALIVIFFSLLIVGCAYSFYWFFHYRNIFSGGEKVESTIAQKILGMSLVFIAQGIQALQTVIGMSELIEWLVEEHLLQGVEAPSLLVVGMEGVWGFILTCIALVIAYFLPGEEGSGLHEDFIDSLILW